MAIRERQIASASFSPGTTQVLDLPRDAVYHMIQLSCKAGSLVSTQGAMGTGPTLGEMFPFNLIRNIRLIRNGSDVVFQGSGALLAKEHLYLNKKAPFARIYTVASNVETLRTLAVRGVTIPANSEGISSSQAQFTTPDAPSSNATTLFDFMMELWLQLGVDDAFYSSLVDARKLASYQLEISWATVAEVLIDGTANTSNVISATVQVSSLDQDNVPLDEKFGTFKRSVLSLTNLQYSSSNQQVLLPRGNYFHGIVFQTLAQKASSTTVLRHENAVISQINNRINSNYTLRSTTFNDLQRKNQNDMLNVNAWLGASGQPNGTAYLCYYNVAKKASELVPTMSMDQFDLQLSFSALASAESGVTTSATLPTVNLLLEELIPGVDIGAAGPRGSQSGSVGDSSAKPYAR